jgi:MSHA biogenesis protein MshM
VNILAHKALMLSFGQGKQQVCASHVRDAARDTIATRRRRRWPWLAAAGGLAAAAAGLTWALAR